MLVSSLAGLACPSKGSSRRLATPPAAPAGTGSPTAPTDSGAAVPADSSGRARKPDWIPYQIALDRADSLLKLRGGSHAEDAQLYLAWGAPWGTRGSSNVRFPACGDSTQADTLYLSFYPGRPSSGFNGVSAELYFHATGSDTLGPWWHMERKGGENGGNMQVEWAPSEDLPGPQPWTRIGRGFALLDRTPTAMRLRLLYALMPQDAGPIAADSTYTICRVILWHNRSTGLAGCGQPVCVEWSKASLAFALRDEPEVRRGERFVSYGAPIAVCEPFRLPVSRAWRPKAWIKP